MFLKYKSNNLGSEIIFRMTDFTFITLFRLLVKDNVMLVDGFFSTGHPAKRMVC